MKVSRFAAAAPLIFVQARLFGPRKTGDLRLALDTGAEQTLIVPEAIEEAGYSARDAEAITTIRSAIGSEPGCLVQIARLRCLGHEIRDFRVTLTTCPKASESTVYWG